MKGTLSFQSSTIEQDTEFSHIDTVISSLTPNTSSSTENELPNSLPVPLLADFGHFEKQDEYMLVESNIENVDDAKTNSSDDVQKTAKTCENIKLMDSDNAEVETDTGKYTDEPLTTESTVLNSGTT